jgi:type VI secretion system protein ImpL
MHTITERLKDLRLLILHKSGSGGVDRGSESLEPGLLLFPEEFGNLKPNLTAFVNSAFQENPYQETPILRGIYYSSGRQEGSPYSHFLKALGLIEQREVLPGTNRSLFLHEFFSRILPKDRSLFAPTQRAIEWSRITRNLGLTAWIAVAVALCGLMSFSFLKNLRTLNDARNYAKLPIFQGEILTDMSIMDRFRQAILKVEDQNHGWWIPRFGLNESEDVEIQLKAVYCKRFNDSFLASLDKQMAQRMTGFSGFTPDAVFGQHIEHIVKRINLLGSRLGGGGIEDLQSSSQPPYSPILPGADQKLILEIRRKFSKLYLYALGWQLNSGTLNHEMNKLQTWLKHLLTLKKTNLHWLAAWVNANSPLPELSLEAFWRGNQVPLNRTTTSDETMVRPAFTRKGKEQIDFFVNEIEKALPEPLIIASQKVDFQKWYRESYMEAWHDFGANFPTGADRLVGREDCLLAAARMPTDQGPYFSLLNRMAEELGAFAGGHDLPSWIELVHEFKAARLQAATMDTLKEKSALGELTKKGKKLIGRTENKMRRLNGGATFESRLIAANAFRDYQNALTEITPVSHSRKVAYQMAKQVFSEDPATSESSFFKAQDALGKLRASLTVVKSDERVFWNLVTGPLDYLWTFVCKETACHLQSLWEKEVLVEVEGVSDKKVVNRLLLGQDGYATKFIEGPAAPFVSRSLGKGFYAKDALEGRIPFIDSFFSFYTKGVTSVRAEPETETVKANYIISVKGLPTDANKEARIRPHATKLEVQCANETIRLVNLNYPVRKRFYWSPQNCGDVVFSIEIGSLVLTRRYKGDRAFPKFLKDFEKGSCTFYPTEFPDEEAALKRFGIEYIKVNYEFQGHQPILDLLIPPKPKIVIPKVPEVIAHCWD